MRPITAEYPMINEMKQAMKSVRGDDCSIWLDCLSLRTLVTETGRMSSSFLSHFRPVTPIISQKPLKGKYNCALSPSMIITCARETTDTLLTYVAIRPKPKSLVEYRRWLE